MTSGSASSLSVCVPNYNGERFLPAALDSLLAQSYRPGEIVVLDDGSTDASLDVIAGYERREPAIRVLRHEQNRGAVEALLTLVDATRGPWVYFAAVDDVVLPGFFERSMRLLERHPSAGLSCGLSRTMDAGGADRGLFPSPVIVTEPAFVSPGEVRKLLPNGFFDWFVFGNTVVYSLDAVRASARRCAGLGPYYDGFLTQVIALERGACFIPEPLGSWRLWDQSYSGQLRADHARQREIADEAHRLMTEDFADLFPAGHADAWRAEVEVALAIDAHAGEGKLKRLRHEAAARRRYGLALRPALARRLRARRDERRRRRIEAARGD